MREFLRLLYLSTSLLAVTGPIWLTGCTQHVRGGEPDLSRSLRRCGVTVCVDDAKADFLVAFTLAARKAALRACQSLGESGCGIGEANLAFLSDFRFFGGIAGFCRPNDTICDVRCFDPQTREMRYVIWVNAKNGAALVWGDRWMKPTLVGPPGIDEHRTFQAQRMTLADARVRTPSELVAAIRAVCPHNDPQKHLWGDDDYRTHIMCVKTVEDDIPEFGKRGDRIWEAIRWERHSRRMLVWVNAETEKPLFLTERWRNTQRDPPSLTYEQARATIVKVRDATDANSAVVRLFAFSMFQDPAIDHVPFGQQVPPHDDWREVWPQAGATDGVGVDYVTKLGFDIPGFAKQGDRIWECELSGFDGTKLVIWVNPQTRKKFHLSRMFEQAFSADGRDRG